MNKMPLMVKGLNLSLNEIGKIKIGRKGQSRTSGNGKTFRLPEKLDHFVITTNERDNKDDFIEDSEIMSKLGDNPKRIPIKLLYNTLETNFQTRYASYKGTTLDCFGDGESFYQNKNGKFEPCNLDYALKRIQPEYTGKDKMKLNGTLSCIIEGVETIGGVWKFRTTGYNSVNSIISSLLLIQQIAGGQLAGIPLDLVLSPKMGTTPTGASVKIYVVSIEYKGSVESLQKVAYNRMLTDQTHKVNVQQIEENAIKLLQDSPHSFDENSTDTIEEFYPEQMEDEDSQKPKKTIKTGTSIIEAEEVIEEEIKKSVEEIEEKKEPTEKELASIELKKIGFNKDERHHFYKNYSCNVELLIDNISSYKKQRYLSALQKVKATKNDIILDSFNQIVAGKDYVKMREFVRTLERGE